MKKLLTFSSLLILSSIAITGCSEKAPETYGSTDQQVVTVEDGILLEENVSSFVKSFYTDLAVNKSEESYSNSNEVQMIYSEIMNADEPIMLPEYEDMISKALESKSEKLPEVAKKLTELNPLSGYIDYEAMSDNEIVALNMLIIDSSSSAKYSFEDKSIVSVNSGFDDAMSGDGNVQLFNSMIEIELENETVLGLQVFDQEIINLKIKDKVIKLDGKKTIETFIEDQKEDI